MRRICAALIFLLPALDLAWNLTHLNIGLLDFYALAGAARAYAQHGVWPATPYFPALYPLLLSPCGRLGGVLVGGYLLSACGLALALYGIVRLAAAFELPPGAAVLTLLLAWADPVWRTTAGSPSVDALYTGLGMWFIAAALECFIKRREALPPALLLRLGLALPAALLPLLRYHGVVLVLPVLLVLLAIAPRRRSLLLTPSLALALALCFNYATYYLAWHEMLPSTGLLQVRSGIELTEHAHYATPEALWADYPAFARKARTSSLLQDYRPRAIVTHTLREWLRYLRRPAVALLLLALAWLAIGRRRIPDGALLAAAWALLYCLALATAYYTARAALLPVAVALVVCMAAFYRSSGVRPGAWLALAAVLVAGGDAVFSRTALADFGERLYCSQLSAAAGRALAAQQLERSQVAVNDWRVLPLKDNPWCEPYAHCGTSWIDDPAVQAGHKQGLAPLDPHQVLAGHTGIAALLLINLGSEHALNQATTDQRWSIAVNGDGYQILRRLSPRGA